jgi:hypothetical protein
VLGSRQQPDPGQHVGLGADQFPQLRLLHWRQVGCRRGRQPVRHLGHAADCALVSPQTLDDSGLECGHEPRCSAQDDSFLARVRYERFADRVERCGDLVGRRIGHEPARDVR